MSIFSNIGKGVKEIGSILTAGYTQPSASGGKTSALQAMQDKYKADLAKAKAFAGGLIPSASAAENDSSGGNNNAYSGSIPTLPGSTQKSSGGGGSSGRSSGGAPQKYDASGRFTEAYKKWRDAQNASSGSSSSAADDARKAQQKILDDQEKARKANDARIVSNIGKGWDDTGAEVDATGKSLDTSNSYINNLGTVRDQMLSSIEGAKNRTDAAIAGNKTLINENQKRELDSLAGNTRDEINKTNIMLGVASGGSASKAFARKIAQDAGKQRAGILTGYGDEISEQNQASKMNSEDYNTKRAKSYEWEKTAREQALDSYNEERDALDRLKNNKSGWREEDIKALSNQRLTTFLNGLAAIQTQARTFRDNLANKMTEYGGIADALDVAAVNVTPPSELDTPKFSENIDFTDPNSTSDWFDPASQPKRVIKGYDAAGNPIYGDEATTETPIV